jgi:hypothetical protein
MTEFCNNINYISLGHSCSPAAAIKSLGLRKYSLPFDWIFSNCEKVIECIYEDFKHFHKNIKLNSEKTKIVDHYNFEFPHDYPTNVENFNLTDDDIVINEDIIIDNWYLYTNDVLEKYQRRIDRFNSIFKSNEDIIVFYRGSVSDVFKYNDCFKQKYNRHNIKYVIASVEYYKNDDIISCNPEMHGSWNETLIWGNALKEII